MISKYVRAAAAAAAASVNPGKQAGTGAAGAPQASATASPPKRRPGQLSAGDRKTVGSASRGLGAAALLATPVSPTDGLVSRDADNNRYPGRAGAPAARGPSGGAGAATSRAGSAGPNTVTLHEHKEAVAELMRQRDHMQRGAAALTHQIQVVTQVARHKTFTASTDNSVLLDECNRLRREVELQRRAIHSLEAELRARVPRRLSKVGGAVAEVAGAVHAFGGRRHSTVAGAAAAALPFDAYELGDGSGMPAAPDAAADGGDLSTSQIAASDSLMYVGGGDAGGDEAGGARGAGIWDHDDAQAADPSSAPGAVAGLGVSHSAPLLPAIHARAQMMRIGDIFI